MDKADFGVRLKALRRARGLTQPQLAQALGLPDHSGISKIENGKQEVRREMIQRIADALGTSVAALLADEIPEPSVEAAPMPSLVKTALPMDRKLLGDFLQIMEYHQKRLQDEADHLRLVAETYRYLLQRDYPDGE